MELLRALRKKGGLTQAELAHRAGIAMNTIARYERGEMGPSMKNIVAIAEVLGVSPAALLDGPAPEEWTLEVKLGESRKEVIDMSATMGNVAEVSCSREGASLILTGKKDTFSDDAKFEDFVSQLRAARGLILRNIEEMEKMRPATAGA